VSLASLERSIPEGDRILLDASALIAHLNGGEAASSAADHVINGWVKPGRNQASVSMITVMELLVQPLRLGVAAPYHTTLDFLTHFPNLNLIHVDIHVAQDAAMLRAAYDFKPPDALTIATGLAAQVGYLVTNDDKWQNKLKALVKRIKVCYLEDYVPL
jgi:predicted nucleic acid-binding protein